MGKDTLANRATSDSQLSSFVRDIERIAIIRSLSDTQVSRLAGEGSTGDDAISWRLDPQAITDWQVIGVDLIICSIIASKLF